MGARPEVVRHRTRDLLSAAAAARLLTALIDAQAARGEAHVVLTGGSMGSAILASLGDSAGLDAVAWDRVSLWWGDERFLPDGHPDRNETQNRLALLERLPLDPTRVHAVAPQGSDAGRTAEDAAADYTRQLASAAAPGEPSPLFDVVLLGVGPDGHIASLFPGRPELDATRHSAVAVHDAPKPPPTRVSLTFRALQHAREVWFIVSGSDKADAVARGVRGDDVHRTPAAHVRGEMRTLWLVDEGAAARLTGH